MRLLTRKKQKLQKSPKTIFFFLPPYPINHLSQSVDWSSNHQVWRSFMASPLQDLKLQNHLIPMKSLQSEDPLLHSVQLHMWICTIDKSCWCVKNRWSNQNSLLLQHSLLFNLLCGSKNEWRWIIGLLAWSGWLANHWLACQLQQALQVITIPSFHLHVFFSVSHGWEPLCKGSKRTTKSEGKIVYNRYE